MDFRKLFDSPFWFSIPHMKAYIVKFIIFFSAFTYKLFIHVYITMIYQYYKNKNKRNIKFKYFYKISA